MKIIQFLKDIKKYLKISLNKLIAVLNNSVSASFIDEALKLSVSYGT